MSSKKVLAVFENLDSEAQKFPTIHLSGETDMNVYIKIISKLLKAGVEYIENDRMQNAYVVLLRCCLISSYHLINHIHYRSYKSIILSRTKTALELLEKIKPIIIKKIASDVNSVKLKSLDVKSNERLSSGVVGSLSRTLKKYGLVEVNVPGDGNCQFHAICDQLAHHSICKIDHVSLRRQLADWLFSNTNMSMDDSGIGEQTTLMKANGFEDVNHWNHYLSLMKSGGLWGDNTTLLAACAVYNMKINVISSEMGYVHKIRCPPLWNIRGKCKIYLIHIFEMHYNSTRKAN